jgi:hypothetical protein
MNKLIISVLLFLSLSCQQNHQIQFWPENGTTFQNISWEIPVADSSLILQQKDGHWILPKPLDNVEPKITMTRHRQPNINPYQNVVGNVSQEVFHDSGMVKREFYRFKKHGILLLGTESRDSTQLITICEPPMVLIPQNLENLDTTYFYEGTPKVWDATADSFRQQQKTRLRLTPKQKGTVMLDSVAVPARLVQMTLSKDGTVGYAGTDLIVPDAIMLQSNILIVEKIGPVLEWGVRSRKKGCDVTATHEIDPGIGNQDRFEEREYYIEVTLHQKVDDRLMGAL